jgi:hypothetical protein
MADVLGTVVDALTNDVTLAALLPGGLYDGRTVQEISRQNTPATYDEWQEIRPCGLIKAETQTPWGPLHDGSRLYVTVWLYAQSTYTALDEARERIYALLHRQQLTTDAGIFDVRHASDMAGLEAPGMPATLTVCRYHVTAMRG